MDNFVQTNSYLTNTTLLGVVVLSLFIILQLVWQKRSINSIKDNHIHSVAETLERIENILNRQSETLSDIKTGIEVVKTKLNGIDK
jgi:F0F1-type ATP synthase membrane subunit b/b'